MRGSGHNVTAPDLYDGDVLMMLLVPVAKIQELGFDEILLRRAVADLPHDLAYIGFSNGGACAELVAATRPGAHRTVLIEGAPSQSGPGMDRLAVRSPRPGPFRGKRPRRNEGSVANAGELTWYGVS